MINVIMFDLDGTLLPINGDDFINFYFKEITKRFAPLGYEPKKLVEWIWDGTKSMMTNDGSKTNYHAFWDRLKEISSRDVYNDVPVFDDFYLKEFDNVKALVPDGYSLRTLFDRLKEKGYKIVLATNPFFPYNAAVTRLGWIGLNIEDFEYITIMENSSYTKPNLKYYEKIFEEIGEKPENCLMVGNNPVEDMCVKEMGCKVFFMPEYIENKNNVDCSQFPQGGFEELEEYLTTI